MNDQGFKKAVMLSSAMFFVFAAVMLFFSYVCSLLCLACGVIQNVIFYYFTKCRLSRISGLNDYLSLVCSGKYDLDMAENTEGELSVLKNNLYKVITLLRTQNDMLKKERSALSDSLADISHQLKTPLSSMTVMTDILLSQKLPGKAHEFLSVMQSQIDKMNWLVQNLLKLSRLDTGTADLKPKMVSVKKIISDSVAPFLIQLELKGIELDEKADDFEIYADRKWTAEAFANIIKNCIEHTDKGGKLTISSENRNIYDAVIIEDTGSGISPDDLPHIFERFYRGKNSASGSVGIGLALAATILGNEKASIDVKSIEGEGSRFEVRFYKGVV